MDERSEEHKSLRELIPRQLFNRPNRRGILKNDDASGNDKGQDRRYLNELRGAGANRPELKGQDAIKSENSLSCPRRMPASREKEGLSPVKTNASRNTTGFKKIKAAVSRQAGSTMPRIANTSILAPSVKKKGQGKNPLKV
jgi:hypothetical protein